MSWSRRSVWWGALGIAAAVGLTLYFAGAVAAHLRVGDYKGTPPAAVLTLIAIALIVCAPPHAERPGCRGAAARAVSADSGDWLV
ncbi:DoxX family protein [Streptomyces sp. HC307]|uniref:DoxX family protein n=1 Tax=Streptomyces flavusporus TaxID=3385496 RepID=UPI0039176612